jgi:hypothetical protein
MSNFIHPMVVTLVMLLVPPTHAPMVHSAPVKAPVVTTTTTTLVSPSVMSEWHRVAWCETHANWQHQGGVYEGGLGIMAINWQYYGGTQYAPHAWMATPEQQVAIAIKIQHGLPTPDAEYCASW